MSVTDEWTTVATTFPKLPPSSARAHATTARLLIRPLAADDLDAIHALRTQPEVMAWSAAGRIDRDRDETAAVLARFMPPHDTGTFNCAICLRATGELVGFGGVHKLNSSSSSSSSGEDGGEAGYGWPELGYMFRREHWGGGLATEFVRAFLGLWEDLRREPAEMRVSAKSVVGVGVGLVAGGAGASGDRLAQQQRQACTAREVLVAVIDSKNAASQRILEKCGFERFDVWTEKDDEDPEREHELFSFRYLPREST